MAPRSLGLLKVRAQHPNIGEKTARIGATRIASRLNQVNTVPPTGYRFSHDHDNNICWRHRPRLAYSLLQTLHTPIEHWDDRRSGQKPAMYKTCFLQLHLPPFLVFNQGRQFPFPLPSMPPATNTTQSIASSFSLRDAQEWVVFGRIERDSQHWTK